MEEGSFEPKGPESALMNEGLSWGSPLKNEAERGPNLRLDLPGLIEGWRNNLGFGSRAGRLYNRRIEGIGTCEHQMPREDQENDLIHTP